MSPYCNHPSVHLVETYDDGAVLYECDRCRDRWVEDPAN